MESEDEMKYVAFVGTDGPQPKEAVAEMNRGFPAYFEEMNRRGVRLLGRELRLPDAGATVRVRGGDRLVTDGPFAETKEFVGGFNLLECADLDEAIEVESKSPVARFLPLEIRPFREELQLGPQTPAFGSDDDSAGVPYMLMVWAGDAPSESFDERAVLEECDAWRRGLEASDVFVLGASLGGPETATTLRFREGEVRVSDGPFIEIDAYIAGIEIVRATDLQRVIELAATHPFARYHAIEARPFYSEATQDGPTE
jgi:hypothetical protein